VRGFALFSIFVGIVMLSIAIAISATMFSQAQSYSNIINQRIQQYSGVFSSTLFSMDAITTFAQALRAAMQSSSMTYTTNISSLEQQVIKNALSDYIYAFTQVGKMPTSTGFLRIGELPTTNEELHRCTTVKAIPDKNVIQVRIYPVPPHIPLAEANIYYELGSDANVATSMTFPLFPVGTNSDILVYFPVSGIQNTIQNVTQTLSKLTIAFGYVRKIPYASIGVRGYGSTVMGGYGRYAGSFAFDQRSNETIKSCKDANFPFSKCYIKYSSSGIQQDKIGTYTPSNIADDVKDIVSAYLKNNGLQVTVTNVTIKKKEQGDKKIPFRKFVCFVGKFADAMAADGQHYTVCVNITGDSALNKYFKNQSGDPKQLPYGYVTEILVDFTKKMANKCIPGGQISPTMETTVSLHTDPLPNDLPENMELNTYLKIPLADVAQRNLPLDYNLQWNQYPCTKDALKNTSYAECNSIGCSDGNEWCDGWSEWDCDKLNHDRETCWYNIQKDVEKCLDWLWDKYLHGYVPDDANVAYCGVSSKWDISWGYKDPCYYCSDYSCTASCTTYATYIADDPWDWKGWNHADFVKDRYFEYDVKAARQAVQGWINTTDFEGNCQAVLDSQICNDIYHHLSDYTANKNVFFIPGAPTDITQIGKDLIQSGGGILAITVVETDEAGKPWKIENGDYGVVYCYNGTCEKAQ